MAIGLDEATDVLKDAVTYVGDDTYSVERLHRAIKAAGLHTLREVPMSRSTVDVAISGGQSTLDMTAEVTGWINTWFIQASIDHYPFDKADEKSIRRLWQGGTPTGGRPTKFAAVSDDYWLFDKPIVADYTVKVLYREPLVAFTPGTSANPTLNIPDEYLYDVLHWGALAYLFKEAGEQHPEAPGAMAKFEQLIELWKPRFGSTRSGVQDRNTVD